MTIRADYVDYQDEDTVCEAYVAYPSYGQGPWPCVLVGHAWNGQNDSTRATADRLAEMGYVGFAVDVYGKGVRGGMDADNSALMAPYMADRALLRRRLLAAITGAQLLARVDYDRIAMIGYCFGGLCALDLARATPPELRGVVSIHGLFTPPNLGPQAPITAKVLALHGWEDPLARPASVEALAKEMTDAGADWQLVAYGHAMHAFTFEQANMPERGFLYNEPAARRSWAALTAFLAEALA